MKVRGTDFVCYQVADLERGIAFYRDTLGMKFLERYGDMWAEFKAAPTTLALYKPEGPLPEQRRGSAFIGLAVEDVKGAVAELKAKGVAVVLETMDTPVCWFAIVADPDGNPVGLHQRKDGTFG